jgi:hypothetical protein
VLVQHRKGGSDDGYRVLYVGAEEDSANRSQRVIHHLGVDIDGLAGRCRRTASIRQARGLIGHNIDMASDATAGEQRGDRPALLPPLRAAAGEQAVTEIRRDFLVVGRVFAVSVWVTGKHLLNAVRVSHKIKRAA